MRVLDRLARSIGLAPASEVASLRAELAAAQTPAEGKSSVAAGVKFSANAFTREFNAALTGARLFDTLDKMATDPFVASALQKITLALVNAEWNYEPASDDPRDVEIAEFANANLLCKGGQTYGRDYWCSTSWEAQRLPEILTMLRNGFAAFAASWRAVGSKTVYDTLKWIEPSSVSKWDLDASDNIVQILRAYTAPDGSSRTDEPLPAESLKLYAWEMYGARYNGQTYLRALYGPWFRKDWLARIATIWASKAGSPIPVGFYPSTFSDDDRNKFDAFIASARGTAPQESYGMFPLGEDGTAPVISYVGADANVDRVGALIAAENAELAQGAQVIQSGALAAGQVGSRALASTLSTAELQLAAGVAKIVAGFETRGIANVSGVLEELIDRNFAGVQRYPRLVVSKIDPDQSSRDLALLGEARQRGLLPDCPSVRRRAASLLGIDLTPDELAAEVSAAPAAPAPPNAPHAEGEPPLPPEPTPTPKEEAPTPEPPPAEPARDGAAPALEAAPMLSAFRVPSSMSPDAARAAGYGRVPTRFEAATLQLGAIAAAFASAQQGFAGALRSAWRGMAEDLVARVRSGALTRENGPAARAKRPKKSAEWAARLREQFVGAAASGQQHVADELRRQRESLPASARLSADSQPPGTIPPRTPRPNVDVAAARAALADEARVSAEVQLDGLWNRLVNEALDALGRSGRTGGDAAADVEARLQGLSESPLDADARKDAAVAYNAGRGFAGVEAAAAGTATWALRSEVLDSATCETCASLDGTWALIDSDEYDALMPPSGCEGGDNCRGVAVIVEDSALDAARREEEA